jgi:hypothetical protein
MVVGGCWVAVPRRGRVEAAGAVLVAVRSLRARSWRGGMVKRRAEGVQVVVWRDCVGLVIWWAGVGSGEEYDRSWDCAEYGAGSASCSVAFPRRTARRIRRDKVSGLASDANHSSSSLLQQTHLAAAPAQSEPKSLSFSVLSRRNRLTGRAALDRSIDKRLKGD